MSLPLLSLFLAGFAIATSSFVVAGRDRAHLPRVGFTLAIPATVLSIVAATLDRHSESLTMPIAIYALALAAFAIGTTEFIVSGILPNVSADLAREHPDRRTPRHRLCRRRRDQRPDRSRPSSRASRRSRRSSC